METNEKIAQLESEIKVLKNEIQAVLLDLRDKYLESENPFNAPAPAAATTTQQIVIDRAPAEAARRPEPPLAPEEAPTAEKTLPRPARQPEAGESSPPEPVADPRTTARPQQSEVSRERSARRGTMPAHDVSLVTVSGLATWADECVRKLGPQRAETILDVTEMMGLINPDLKRIVSKLISVEAGGHTDTAEARDYFNALVRITTLLGKDNQQEEALLAVIAAEDGHR